MTGRLQTAPLIRGTTGTNSRLLDVSKPALGFWDLTNAPTLDPQYFSCLAFNHQSGVISDNTRLRTPTLNPFATKLPMTQWTLGKHTASDQPSLSGFFPTNICWELLSAIALVACWKPNPPPWEIDQSCFSFKGEVSAIFLLPPSTCSPVC